MSNMPYTKNYCIYLKLFKILKYGRHTRVCRYEVLKQTSNRLIKLYGINTRILRKVFIWSSKIKNTILYVEILSTKSE